jgi:hypothetical protein
MKLTGNIAEASNLMQDAEAVFIHNDLPKSRVAEVHQILL